LNVTQRAQERITVYRNRRGGVPKKNMGPYIVIRKGTVHVAWTQEAKKALQSDMLDSFQKRMNKVVDRIVKKEET